MDTVGTFEMAKALCEHGCLVAIHKHYPVAAWQAFVAEAPAAAKLVAVSMGTSQADAAKVDAILSSCPEVTTICIDVANGYAECFVDRVRETRQKWPTHTIMAGNVVTNEMTEEIILNGADIVKVGIGPGSVCTTRKQTGVGYPQVSAVIECADAAHGLGGHIVSDGGITCPGDAAKAFGAGADFIMMGGLFSGTDEPAGDVLVKPDGSKVKLFYGMSSSVAMGKHAGGVAEYRSSEGKAVEVPAKGPVTSRRPSSGAAMACRSYANDATHRPLSAQVRGVILDLLGGIRSTCTYVGASSLRELPKRTTFIRVTQQINTVFGSHDLSKGGKK